MCETMGSEPLEEEMPIDRQSLATETQMVLDLYDKLSAKWEGFSGQYLGKDLGILPMLMNEYNFESYMRKYALTIIPIIDSFVAEDVAQKVKSKSKGK